MTAAASPSRAELTPLSFLLRSAEVWRDRPAVEEDGRCWTYPEHLERVRRAAGLLRGRGVGTGDRVATLLTNTVSMLELHYAVPAVGAVLVPLNTRLAVPDYAYILRHSGARLVVATEVLREPLLAALAELGADAPAVIWADADGAEGYEAAIAAAPAATLELPESEDALLSINYTSGTTGLPKGVMTTHRGAYLHTLGVCVEAGLTTRSVYLWTLPMFHCNGWAYTWAVTAMGAKHVCLPRLEVDRIWASIEAGVTHLCAAPTVVSMMMGAAAARPPATPVKLFVGGAPPTPTLLERAASLNIEVTHLYGLTETYGPVLVCAWNPRWDGLAEAEQARLRARQGVPTVVSDVRVFDPETMAEVAADGETTGEIVVRGNNVMRGYYRDPETTAQAFAGGRLHTGDLAVRHPDGYIELRDRLKDTIISGGENIATVEVEQALAAFPGVEEAAVVGAPDETWGEAVVAYVTVVPGRTLDLAELRGFARDRIARFKVPKRISVVEELPKTGTGKIKKFVLRGKAADES